VIAAAQDALRRNFHWHGVGTFLAQGCFDRLGRLTAAVGEPGLELSLLAGFGTYEEQRLVEDLRALAGGGLGLDAFLAEHGFHGQGAAELAVPSWRVDPAGPRRTAAAYRDRPPAAGARAAHAEALARLRSAARGPRWAEARVLLAAGRRFMPLREVGRSGVLRCADTARLAAAVIASRLVAEGKLADPADVVHLGLDELASGQVTPELVEQRRRAHARHRAVELPERWTGAPRTVTAAAPTPGGGELTGIPAGPGVVEGVARVVLDPDEADQDLADGEVLVCHATDPSWAATFTLAAGLVIDIGSALSHGAILARELGLPCVINTRTGTTRIRTGDRVRVDGTTGTVTVLSPGTPRAA
jgi:phosphohistidine swiveling domain-containing protein